MAGRRLALRVLSNIRHELRPGLFPASGRSFLQSENCRDSILSRLSTSQGLHVGAGSGGRCGGLAMRNPPDGLPFAVKGLNHIAIAVPDLEEAAEHYRTIFGAQVSAPLAQPGHGVTVVFVHFCNVTIELLHPLGESSPVAKFLEKNPRGGIHHLCFTVDDILAASDHVKDSGISILGKGQPQLGAHQNPVIFLKPQDNFGVLYELEQVGVVEKEEKVA